MTVIEYFCDYCGKQIENKKDLVSATIDRDLMSDFSGNTHLDLCVKCAKKIFNKERKQ